MRVFDHAKTMVRRFSACMAVGVAMAGTTYVCAWYNMRDYISYRWGYQRASVILRTMRTALNDYHAEKGKYPDKLADLAAIYPDRVVVDVSGQVVDPWNHPFQYRAEGRAYSLYSLGGDGKLGGEGLDQDLDVRDLPPDEGSFFRLPKVGVPTLWQFATERGTGGVQITCALTGIFAFITCLKSQRAGENGLPFRPIKLVITLVACLLTAVVISMVHIPNNH
jgi:Type II secretion system (T2SS), protein G